MNLQINAKLVSNWIIIVYILLTNLFALYGQKSLALLQVFYKLQSCKIAQKQRKTPGSYIVSKTEKWTPSNSSPFLSASKSFTKLTKKTKILSPLLPGTHSLSLFSVKLNLEYGAFIKHIKQGLFNKILQCNVLGRYQADPGAHLPSASQAAQGAEAPPTRL